MPIELAPEARTRFPAISWPAIFAALTVGISIQLLLTLGGFAFGVYAFDSIDDTQTVPLAAASWGAASMLVSSLIGGYVAARASGLRRTSDGVLHGLVSWGAATLLYAVLATTAVGALTTGLFGLLGTDVGSAAASAAVGTPQDRDRALQALTELGMSPDQARGVLQHMSGAAGEGEAAPAAPVEAVGSATLWLSAAVLFSLVLGVMGGVMGARGSRRIVREQRPNPAPRPRILGRS